MTMDCSLLFGQVPLSPSRPAPALPAIGCLPFVLAMVVFCLVVSGVFRESLVTAELSV